MKTLTLEQFNALTFDYSIDEAYSELENNPYPVGEDLETGEVEYRDCFNSCVAGSGKATCGDIAIEFAWIANGGQDSYQDAHEFEIELQDCAFEISGFKLIDEDGDEFDPYEVDDAIRERLQGEEWERLVEIELPEPDTNDIDIDEDSEMETFTIEIDNAPALHFTGEELGAASSTDDNAAGSSYSGSTGRWTKLTLYKTKGGKYICHQVGYTRWQGERTRYSGEVCDTLEEVKAFFGHRWLAKELYADAQIDDVTEIE